MSNSVNLFEFIGVAIVS